MVEDLFFMLSKSVKKGITDSLKDEITESEIAWKSFSTCLFYQAKNLHFNCISTLLIKASANPIISQTIIYVDFMFFKPEHI